MELGNKVRNLITDLIRLPVENSVFYSVWGSVENSVWASIQSGAFILIRTSIQHPIRNRINWRVP